MKKTLIALAVVAVSGAAFAQSSVTLSGKLRFAYEATKSTTAAGVSTKANGLRVTDGDFALTAVEDLGGGLKATGFMNVQSRGRDTAISGRDAYVSLAGGFGSVLIGSIEAGNGIIGLGGAGAPVYGMDGPVIAAASNVDILQYTSPSFSGFNVSATMVDQTTILGQNSAEAAIDAYGLGASYANGPIAAKGDYYAYGNNAVPASAAVPDQRVRVSGSYDLGVAKLGAGYEKKSFMVGDSRKDFIVGVSAPLGPVVVGLNYATSKQTGATVKGLDLGVQYNLSKRTYMAAHFENVKNVGYVADAKSDKFRIQLAHSF